MIRFNAATMDRMFLGLHNSPQFSFIESLIAQKVDTGNVLQRLGKSLAIHSALWKEETHRNAAIEILTILITNRLLFEDQYGTTNMCRRTSYFLFRTAFCVLFFLWWRIMTVEMISTLHSTVKMA